MIDHLVQESLLIFQKGGGVKDIMFIKFDSDGAKEEDLFIPILPDFFKNNCRVSSSSAAAISAAAMSSSKSAAGVMKIFREVLDAVGLNGKSFSLYRITTGALSEAAN